MNSTDDLQIRARAALDAAMRLFLISNDWQPTEDRWSDPADRDNTFPLFGAVRAQLQRETNAECTGLSAVWCPVHGDCTCPYLHGDVHNGRTLDDPSCSLHAPTSAHGETGDTEQWP